MSAQMPRAATSEATAYVGAGLLSVSPEEAVSFAAVVDLAKHLNTEEPRLEGWFSLNRWAGNSRGADVKGPDCFQASWGIAVDIDQVEKQTLSGADRATFEAAVQMGRLPGSFAYATCGGFRVVFVFGAACTSYAEWLQAARGANVLVTAALVELGLAERFTVDDSVTTDAKRVFFSPKAIIPKDETKGFAPGQARTGEALVVRESRYTVADLARHAPKLEVAEAPTRKAVAPAPGLRVLPSSFERAAAEFNAGNPLDLTDRVGTCPGCGHHDCAKLHRDDDQRGLCYSTNHDPAVHGGVRSRQDGTPCTVFDALDVHAARAGLEPDEFLRRQGLRGGSRTSVSATPPAAPPEAENDPVPATLPSDLMNAERLVAAARGEFLFVHGWNVWLRFDGTRWKADAGRSMHELASKVARSLWHDAESATTKEEAKAASRHALTSLRRERIEAMVYLASTALPDLKATPEVFDQDEFAFNVENGTLDLRTGTLRPHRREDRITKLAPVAFDPSATAPRWQKFLQDVLPDDATRRFVQKAIGYSATASVREHVLMLLFATGRNGKSTLLEVIRELLGEYAAQCPPDLLLAKRTDRHPTELAALVGKRMVTSSEAGKGRSWDEARLKWLTGGDRLTARRMREDFFEFDPTHKFWVAVNHRPRVHGTDVGIWSRIKTIPFTQEFRDADDPEPTRQHLPVKDATLKAKLLTERPGILNWVVAGCLAWQREGLGEPETVRAATAGYRNEEDALAPFLDAHAGLFDGGRCSLEELAKKYREHAEASGEKPVSNRVLAEELRDRGYTIKKAHGKRWVFVPTVTVVTPGAESGDPVTMGVEAAGLLPIRARAEASYVERVTHGPRVTRSDLTPLQVEMLGRLHDSPDGVDEAGFDQFRVAALNALQAKGLAERQGTTWLPARAS